MKYQQLSISENRRAAELAFFGGLKDQGYEVSKTFHPVLFYVTKPAVDFEAFMSLGVKISVERAHESEGSSQPKYLSFCDTKINLSDLSGGNPNPSCVREINDLYIASGFRDSLLGIDLHICNL